MIKLVEGGTSVAQGRWLEIDEEVDNSRRQDGSEKNGGNKTV